MTPRALSSPALISNQLRAILISIFGVVIIPDGKQTCLQASFAILRHNCSSQSYFISQSQILKKKILQKGYPARWTDEAFTKYQNNYDISNGHPKDTSLILHPSFPRFITTFNHDFRNIQKIF